MPLRLVSVPMTEDELAALRRRRGYWLRLAREQANMDQNSVARELGMSARSGTSVLAWEKGKRSPSMDQLDRLARIYGVPLATFTEPRPTDEEWLQGLAAAALEAEAEDWEASQERGSDPAAGGVGAEPPGRRTA
jgi:transcriptional regulator with XRE-family HTH domain